MLMLSLSLASIVRLSTIRRMPSAGSIASCHHQCLYTTGGWPISVFSSSFGLGCTETDTGTGYGYSTGTGNGKNLKFKIRDFIDPASQANPSEHCAASSHHPQAERTRGRERQKERRYVAAFFRPCAVCAAAFSGQLIHHPHLHALAPQPWTFFRQPDLLHLLRRPAAMLPPPTTATTASINPPTSHPRSSRKRIETHRILLRYGQETFPSIWILHRNVSEEYRRRTRTPRVSGTGTAPKMEYPCIIGTIFVHL
ncbi:hypothetical protein LXL04_023653 [Taraxacum kok-saghyz]